MSYYTLLTDIGRAKIAQMLAGEQLSITEIAVGDGDYSPNGTETELLNEVYRSAVNTLNEDEGNPYWYVAKLVLPSDAGGFWIREAGVFDSDGDMIAICKYPPTYKPDLTSGASKGLTLSIVFEVDRADSVTLQIDPSVVLATREYVDKRPIRHIHTQNTPQLMWQIDHNLDIDYIPQVAAYSVDAETVFSDSYCGDGTYAGDGAVCGATESEADVYEAITYEKIRRINNNRIEIIFSSPVDGAAVVHI